MHQKLEEICSFNTKPGTYSHNAARALSLFSQFLKDEDQPSGSPAKAWAVLKDAVANTKIEVAGSGNQGKIRNGNSATASLEYPIGFVHNLKKGIRANLA